MEGMIRRALDWGGYFGIAVLAFGAILPFVRPEWNRFRWIFLAVGVLLVLLSLLDHFDTFARGVLDTKDVLYYVDVTVLALFLTLRSLEARRWKG